MNLRNLIFTFLAAPLLFAHADSEAVRDQHVEAQLIADQSTIVPGQPFTLGLKLSIDPTWHTYWKNPGETGKPTTLDLTLPGGFTAGELQFPVPKRFVIDYSSASMEIFEAGFGYEDSVIHPVTITAPASLKAGETITISGRSTWLMCDPKECVPGKADLSITLQVGAEAVRSSYASAIGLYAKKVPLKKDWPTAFSLNGENAVVTVEVPDGVLPPEAPLHFFPHKIGIFDQLSVPEVARSNGSVRFTFEKDAGLAAAPDFFSGIVIAETPTGKKGYAVATGEAPDSPAASSRPEGTDAPAAETTEPAPFGGGLFGFLLAAFFGGMILNIMPCVFPVISLKVMSFVGQAGEDQKKVFAHSLIFTLGILVFFWLLATLIIVLKSLGHDPQWGFLLRQPGFVIGLIFVMAIVALSLFGVFEIGTSLTSVGGNLVSKSGYAGSFWSGALAVLLATPCTAPLMAPAIAFAFAQSAPIMVLVFTALGLGMAAPYFLLAIFPKLLDVIPPPGAWMETFKQFMGFPMLAVIVWLIGVLSRQLDVGGLQWALSAVLLVGLAAWILGRFCGPERSGGARTKGRIAALILFLGSIFLAAEAVTMRAPFNSDDLSEIIANHRSEGKHVFVDFTAEWCLTCKVNERTTIKTEAVQNLFKENNIEFVIADWTNEDPSITKVLKEHGRSGVPFYLLYPADTSKRPVSLGDGIITMGAIEEAIEQVTQ